MNNSCPHCRAVFNFDGLVGYVENRNQREMRDMREGVVEEGRM